MIDAGCLILDAGYVYPICILSSIKQPVSSIATTVIIYLITTELLAKQEIN
jgi:hypothetical protein